jgi:hypothetical protein
MAIRCVIISEVLMQYIFVKNLKIAIMGPAGVVKPQPPMVKAMKEGAEKCQKVDVILCSAVHGTAPLYNTF